MLWRPGRSSRNGAWALLALLSFSAAAYSLTEAAAPDGMAPERETHNDAKTVPTNIRNLLLWILQNDGVVDLVVDEVNEEGLRGVKAARDMAEGQVAVKIPRVLGAVLGEWNLTSEENALALLKRKTVEEWDSAMRPYWESLPEPDQLMTKEMMPLSALPLLQDASMPAFVRIHQDFTRTVLRGGKPQIVKDVRAHLGRNLELDEFKYWTALVASYSFTFPDDSGNTQVRVMLPLMDLFNHANADEANINMYKDEKGDYFGYANRPIAKGEQLRHTYNKGCERNDHSLFHYGFVQITDPPRLAALDLPEGNLYDEAAFSEQDYEPGGSLWNAEELERLSAILAAFPTIEAEDKRLLSGGSWLDKLLGRQPLSGRFERLFVEYRMLRKQALQATIDRLRSTLEAAKNEL